MKIPKKVLCKNVVNIVVINLVKKLLFLCLLEPEYTSTQNTFLFYRYVDKEGKCSNCDIFIRFYDKCCNYIE